MGIFLFIPLWLASIAWGYEIGRKKGLAFDGVIYPLLLGFVGVAIVHWKKPANESTETPLVRKRFLIILIALISLVTIFFIIGTYLKVNAPPG
ncbi:MAG: hypothetical protein P1V20_12145 [Verrucomicrobiales bacterium]|nr:hypothetical protein [Verrucomicrobiales bacterium]